jgi:predicted nucleic acid-binding protein
MPAKTAVDAGPLVALFDRSDQHHPKALEFMENFEGEFISTVAVVTEVAYLLDFSVAAQADFIDWLSAGAIELVHLGTGDLERIAVLIAQYADLPMDFADASLVAVCERQGIRQVATLDSDFHIYRLDGKDSFINIFPASGH